MQATASSRPFFSALEHGLHHSLSTPLLHKVDSGDTLSQIIWDYYHASYGSFHYRQIEATILALNPALTHPDAIRSGQVLRLLPVPSAALNCPIEEELDYRAALSGSLHQMSLPPTSHIGPHIPADRSERELFWALSWLEQNYSWLSQPAGAGLTSLGLLTGPGNTTLIQQVGTAYEQYRQGQLSKGQYDYRRRQALRQFAQRTGPMERLLLKGQSATDAIRISRIRGFPPHRK